MKCLVTHVLKDIKQMIVVSGKNLLFLVKTDESVSVRGAIYV